MPTKEKIQQTMSIWQPYYAKALDEADGREIVDTVSAYMSIISEWVQITHGGTQG